MTEHLVAKLAYLSSRFIILSSPASPAPGAPSSIALIDRHDCTLPLIVSDDTTAAFVVVQSTAGVDTGRLVELVSQILQHRQ